MQNPIGSLTEFNHLKQEVKINKNILLVSVDIAKDNHTSAFEMTSGEILRKKFSFSNDREGFDAFINKIDYYCRQQPIEKVLVGMEATACYWKAFSHYLARANIAQVLVNTFTVKNNRQTLNLSKDKNDAKDCHNICDLMRQGKFHFLNLQKYENQDLTRLYRMRFSLMKDKARIRIKLRHLLSEIFPELERQTANILGKTMLAILQKCPFPKDVLQIDQQELTQLILEASRHKLGEKKARSLYQLAQTSVGIDSEELSTRLELSLLLKKLKAIEQDVGVIEKQLFDAVKNNRHYQLLLSIKGIGPIAAAGLVAEIGDIRCYTHAKQLTKLAGLDLWANFSGKSVRSGKHISKKGRKILRTVVYEAAITCVRCNRLFKNKFLNLLENQPRRRKIKALAYVAIADKLLRIVFRMLTDGTAFNPNYETILKERYQPKAKK